MYVCIVSVLTTTSPIAHSSERKLKWDHERITIEAMIDTGACGNFIDSGDWRPAGVTMKMIMTYLDSILGQKCQGEN